MWWLILNMRLRFIWISLRLLGLPYLNVLNYLLDFRNIKLRVLYVTIILRLRGGCRISRALILFLFELYTFSRLVILTILPLIIWGTHIHLCNSSLLSSSNLGIGFEHLHLKLSYFILSLCCSSVTWVDILTYARQKLWLLSRS